MILNIKTTYTNVWTTFEEDIGNIGLEADPESRSLQVLQWNEQIISESLVMWRTPDISPRIDSAGGRTASVS